MIDKNYKKNIIYKPKLYGFEKQSFSRYGKQKEPAMSIKKNLNNLKNTHSYSTDQGLERPLGSPKGKPMEALEKSTKRLSFINLFLFTLGIINVLILTYFCIRNDIRFSPTGLFPIPENIH